MQQTKIYKLNLIEKDDVFSPDPLNDNARATDGLAALADFTALTEAYTRTKADAALDQRVTALEAHKIVVGRYKANGQDQIVDLGFTPVMVLVHLSDYFNPIASAMAITGCPAYYQGPNEPCVSIVEGGFKLHAADHTQYFNRSGYYPFVALG